MSLAAGSRIGPYEVKSLLGEGGMGQVWRAHDTRLQRDVALKVLPAETFGDDPSAGSTSSPQAGSGSSRAKSTDETARARLVREARLASKLNHPHICTIYEVGETVPQTPFVLSSSPLDAARGDPERVEGSKDERRAEPVGSGLAVTYIAMELVEGQPLSARLSKGPLPVDQVLRYGQQMADALAHAHGRGVVHRDLKSANIVITPDDQVKVLGFGLAKRLTGDELAEATTVSRQSPTGLGMVAGTLAYLAPEQLRGQPADERSDIWALGIVLREMATGTRPFQGQTGFELTSAILSQPLPPLPSSIPAPLAGVIDRCLAKEPGERYQQSTEVRAALEAVASGQAGKSWRMVLRKRRGLLLGAATGALALVVVAAVLLGLDVGGVRSRITGGAAVPARIIRLAVLPFANLSGSADQEYFSDGLTQELITQLGRLHPAGLEVIARTSVMRYKKGDTPVDQIGRELKLDYILQGSARLDGTVPGATGRVRIAAQLVKVADQTQLWAEEYGRELAGILVLQSDVARNVARALALRLLPAEQARLANARAVTPEAYDAYLKGTYLWQTLTREDVDTAERYFELALGKDPSYAPAYEGLAWVWVARQQRFYAPADEAGPKARAAALQAIALDDTSAGTHEALAAVAQAVDWDWVAAEAEWKRAIEMNPNNANTHAHFGQFLAMMGRPDEAIPHGERSIELDPLNTNYLGFHARLLCYAGRYDEAIAVGERARERGRTETGPGAVAVECALIARGMRNEHIALQRERIGSDPERLAAFNQGLSEGGYEAAMRRVADLLALRYDRSRGAPDPNAAALASQPPRVIAAWYMNAGDHDLALDWLEKALEVHDPQLLYLAIDPRWDAVRSDPRFQTVLHAMKLPLR